MDDWTRNDLLAHMAWRHDHSVLVIESLRAGRQPYDGTDPANTTDALNERTHREHLADAPELTRRAFNESFTRLLAALEPVTDDDLFADDRWPWLRGRRAEPSHVRHARNHGRAFFPSSLLFVPPWSRASPDSGPKGFVCVCARSRRPRPILIFPRCTPSRSKWMTWSSRQARARCACLPAKSGADLSVRDCSLGPRRPSRNPIATASARLAAPSFTRTFEMCHSTVLSAMFSAAAASFVVCPAAMYRRISVSRGERRTGRLVQKDCHARSPDSPGPP